MKQFVIKKEEENQTIEKYIKKVLYNYPLSSIYKLFRLKDVKVNNARVDKHHIIKEGDLIKIYIKDFDFNDIKKIDNYKKTDEIKNLIIYEDENILILNKPRGTLVQKDEASYKKALDTLVIEYLYFKGEFDPNDNVSYKPSPAHRIDRNTSGILIFGKNISALHELQRLIQDKESLKKQYLALVKGKVDKSGRIDVPILKNSKNNYCTIDLNSNDAKSAITEYAPILFNEDYSLLNVTLLSGRTHQIRVHMAYIDHPVVGDNKYGDFNLNKIFYKQFQFENQFLHSYKITFLDPHGILSYLKNKTFEAELSENMTNIIKKIFQQKF